MTTIAYHHESKTIAFDSRSTCGDTIVCDETNKCREVGDLRFIMAGQVSDEDIFINEYINRTGKFTPVDLVAYIIDSGKLYRAGMSEFELWTVEVCFSRTDGSGAKYALAAMDMGANAEQAVKMAMKRDPSTGGKINTIRVL